MMHSSSNARRLRMGSALSTLAFLSAGALTAPAGAQTTSAPPPAPLTGAPAESTPAAGEAAPQQEIVVTGSRIVSPNLTSASPVNVVNAQEIRLQGATRIEDVLNTLPQSFAAQSSSVSNGSNGTATANLRNLGENRTLVLINGRRLQPGNPSSSSTAAAAAPDLNVIPSNLIKRVEVLTGGASSVYGSDAVAGVVNFVLDTDYKGFSIDASHGLFMHDNSSNRFRGITSAAGYQAPRGTVFDGGQTEFNVKAGLATSDGRGHVVLYGGYRRIGAVLQGDRDYSYCGLAAGSTDYVCSGSPTAYPANLFLGNGNAYAVGPGKTIDATRSNIYNANPLNYFQRPDRRYTAGVMAHFDINDAVKPYFEFNFMDDRSDAQIAPGGLFAGSGGGPTSINCDNPLLSAAQAAAICTPDNLVDGDPTRGVLFIARRNVEGGGRDTFFHHRSYRYVGGVKGDLGPAISYDVSAQYGRTELELNVRNEFSLTRATRATDVIADPRAGATFGQPVCRSVVDGTDLNCVPLDVFGTNPITAAALNYVEGQGFQTGLNTETVVTGSITIKGGEYGLQTPWASEGLAINVGGEYRRETTRLNVDQAFATGDLTGQGGPTAPIAGRFNVKEGFIEAQLPLVSDMNFLHELSISGGYRYSDYSTSGSVSSYKGQLVWAPVRDIRFRGGYNRAVRAPNTSELFAPQSVQIDGSTDPCANLPNQKPQFTPEQCARTGVTNLYGSVSANPAAQYSGLLGGNPNLKPEKADTYTVGVILQPSFLRGFTATIDAFSVKIRDIIGQIGADTIITQCGLTGDPLYCSLVNRNSAGSLFLEGGYIVDTNLNAGTLKTRGIDVSLAYNYRTANAGTFAFSMSGTYLDEYRISKAGVNYDCAGFFGSGCQAPNTQATTPLPRWRHTARVTWDSPFGVGISARWRYFSRVKIDASSSDPDLTGSFFARDAQIKAQSYFDLTLSTRIADRMSLRLGANNLLDKRPPILSQRATPIGAYGNGDTYPGLYDSNGRYIFVGASVDF